MNDLELRQWCVRIGVKSGVEPIMMRKWLGEIYDFVALGVTHAAGTEHTYMVLPEADGVPDAQSVPEQEIEQPAELPWKPEPLKEKERKVMIEALKLRAGGLKITGNAIAEEIGLSQPMVGIYIRRLVEKDYIRKDGHKFTAIRALSGDPLPPIKQVMPLRAAKGYDPLRVPIAEIVAAKESCTTTENK